MNASLGYTSVSSTTILSSMSGFFTLGIGACAGVEKFTPSKLASVVLRSVISTRRSFHHRYCLPSFTLPNLGRKFEADIYDSAVSSV